jgi:AAA domain
MKRALRYFLSEPFTWIIYCYFQPLKFKAKVEAESFRQRTVIMARLLLPMFLLTYPLALLLHICLNPSQFTNIISFGPVSLGVTLAIIIGSVAFGLATVVEFGLMMGLAMGIAAGGVGNVTGSILGSILVTTFVGIVRRGMDKNLATWFRGEHAITPFIRTFTKHAIEGAAGGITGAFVGWIIGNIPIAAGIVGAIAGFSMGAITEDFQGMVLLVLFGSIVGSTLTGLKEGILVSLAAGVILGTNIAESFAQNVRLGITYMLIVAASVTMVGFLKDGNVNDILVGITLLASYFINYYRIPQYPVTILSSLKTYLVSRQQPRHALSALHTSSFYWNTVFLPLPGLKRTLLIAAREDLEQVLEDISYFVSNSPGLIGATRDTSLEIMLSFMEKCTKLDDIAKFSVQLTKILPPGSGLIDPLWITPFTRLNSVSKDVSLYYKHEDWQSKGDALEQASTQLQQIYPSFISRSTNLNTRLDEIIMLWLNLVQKTLEELREEKGKTKTVEQIVASLNTTAPEVMKEDNLAAFKQLAEDYFRQHLSEKLIFRDADDLILYENRVQVVAAWHYWQTIRKYVSDGEVPQSEQLLEEVVSLLSSALLTTFIKVTALQDRFGSFYSTLLDAQYIFEYVPLPRQFPVILYMRSQFSESDAAELRHLMLHFGSQSHSALLLLFMDPEHLQGALKLLEDNLRSAHAYNIVPVIFKEFSRVIGSKDPQKVFRQLVLSNVDLTVVSPFVTTGPTSNSMFFGREHELRMITEHAHDTNYALVGGRRIGKTSILARLRDIRLPAAGFRAFFLDCSNAPSQAELVANASQRWFFRSPDKFTSFADILDALPADKPLVILLDEVDALIAPDQSAGYPLLNTLRAFANSGHSHFILSGERVLRANMKDPTSPLFNFANEMLVGCLKFHAVQELIVRPMQHLEIELTNESEIVRRIWEFTSGHPSVIQRLCQRLISRLELRQVLRLSLDDVEAVITDYDFLQEDFLETYWERATSLERLCSLLMARDNRLNMLVAIHEALSSLGIHPTLNEVNDALNRLIDLHNILQRTAEGYYQFAVSAFPEVIAQTHQINDLILLTGESYRHEADMKGSR